MTTDLAWEVTEAIRRAQARSERLVLLAGFGSRGKTAALNEVAGRTGAPLVNVNLELSRRLLDLTSTQRPLQVGPLLEEILAETRSEVVLLNRLELLFDTTLHQNPLRLLKDLSRQRTVVAAWNGFVDGSRIRYAEPGHPEYRRDAIDNVPVVCAEGGAR